MTYNTSAGQKSNSCRFINCDVTNYIQLRPQWVYLQGSHIDKVEFTTWPWRFTYFIDTQPTQRLTHVSPWMPTLREPPFALTDLYLLQYFFVTMSREIVWILCPITNTFICKVNCARLLRWSHNELDATTFLNLGEDNFSHFSTRLIVPNLFFELFRVWFISSENLDRCLQIITNKKWSFQSKFYLRVRNRKRSLSGIQEVTVPFIQNK